ncbi:RNA polymerase sigma-70 factor [Bacteroides sedimenti]|uniref:DNA-directed RNA polymerase sigma-70 factor n=1 Tax=Bacteroides sedimenti TaxID=2136147 RepID=A0ABM8I729_9BACE
MTLLKNKPEDNARTISLLKSGNEDTFDNVFRYYYKGLCAFASQYVSFEESEEIVQDTMMWLWENRGTLIPEMSLKSLLFVIVKNKALNRISHNQMKDRIMKDMTQKFEEQFTDPDFYLENELMTLLSEAINKLPEEQRIAFEMSRMDGMTHKEIAEKLNVSPQTVNYRISQSVKFLHKELKNYLPLIIYMLN